MTKTGKADGETTLQELKDLAEEFSKERSWQKHHKPRNLSMNIAVEAAELMEHYLWERDEGPDRREIADELSDVILSCLLFAVAEDIDISRSFRDKLARIKKKYPTTIFNEKNDSLEAYQKIKQEYRRKGGK